MDLLPQGKRIWSVDLLRGVFIFIIILAHSIFFFHSGINALLTGINSLANTISFTGLLFISGITAYIAYVHERHPTRSVISRVSKRIFIYLIGYYILAILGQTILEGWSTQAAIEILLFFRLVPFTEFIIAFIIFGLLKIPLRQLYQKIAHSWIWILAFGIGLFIVGSYLSQISIPYLPLGWKAILVGQQGWYSFPVFQYFIVYLLGMIVGYHFYAGETKRYMYKELGVLAATGGLITGISYTASAYLNLNHSDIFQRFPPTLPFLMAGIAIVALALFALLHHHFLRRISWWRTFFLILGQNAYALFFTHTFLMFLFVASPLPPVNSTILVIILWLISLLAAVYLARILPINLKFELSLVDWCDCQFHPCPHGEEFHQQQLSRNLAAFTKISDIFSLPIGRRKIRLLHPRHLVVAGIILLFVVAPLGLAEDNQIIRTSLENSTGITNRTWFLTAYPHQQLEYFIKLPEDIILQRRATVLYQIDDYDLQPMNQENELWKATIDVSSMSLGKHQVKTVVQIGGNEIATQPSSFNISDPVYVTWTIDWEGYDANQSYLDALTTISEEQQMPMTQLFNPRIYTAPDITPERVEYLTAWVKNRGQLYGEEIGLHLHMFPDFIQAAGLEVKTQPVWGGGFTEGYDILTTTYDSQEMYQILEFAKSMMNQHGFDQPRSYRAGAWFANTETLSALEQAEFLIDTSARTQYQFGTNHIPGFWNVAITTQPYNPSTTDQNSYSPPPQFDILEIPNNGADSFAFTAEQMIDRFNQNYPGGVSHHLRQITYLSHPHWFNPSRQDAMRQVFTHINQYRFDTDHGPVIPTSLMGVYRAWTDN